MKKKQLHLALTALSLLFVIGSAYAQPANASGKQGFTITGKINGLTYPYIYFQHTDAGKPHFDSCAVKDGAFSFKGRVDEAQLVFLHTKDGKLQKIFYAENLPLTVEGDASALDKVVVKGSRVQDDYAKLETELKAIEQKALDFFTAADKAKIDGDVKKAEELEKRAHTTYKEESSAVRKAFIQNNLKSPVTLQALMNWTNEDNYEEAIAMFDKLDESVKSYKMAGDFQKYVEGMSKAAIGKDFIDFTQNDVSGKPTSLSSYKGKYVLVEFWASWCGPCRAENPNLRAAYLKYHDKGFNVLGVSLDDKEDKWKKAVEKDDLPWAQVSDLKGWQNSAAVQYGVRAIPANFLIDPSGKIIKKNLRGEELNKALSELFN